MDMRFGTWNVRSIYRAGSLRAVAKLRRFKSPGNDQIPAERIQAGGEILRSKIDNLINSIWNKEEFGLI
jgi:hypothetical protein